MNKPLLQLSEDASKDLAHVPDAGIGFYVLSAILPNSTKPCTLLVGGINYVVPFDHDRFYSVSDLVQGVALPISTITVSALGSPKAVAAGRRVTLPLGFGATSGAVQLIGTVVLQQPTEFVRFIGVNPDHRFVNGSLSNRTYLTSVNDDGYANTGFAAVGRYALPLPVPASFVFRYRLRKGTVLRVGTALPSFGQAGGGRYCVDP